jgi:hypothetical protein
VQYFSLKDEDRCKEHVAIILVASVRMILYRLFIIFIHLYLPLVSSIMSFRPCTICRANTNRQSPKEIIQSWRTLWIEVHVIIIRITVACVVTESNAKRGDKSASKTLWPTGIRYAQEAIKVNEQEDWLLAFGWHRMLKYNCMGSARWLRYYWKSVYRAVNTVSVRSSLECTCCAFVDVLLPYAARTVSRARRCLRFRAAIPEFVVMAPDERDYNRVRLR